MAEWDTANVTNMNLMFYECSSLKEMPKITKWKTKKVHNIKKNGMFDNCTSLSKIPKMK
jgi:surface protein